MSKENQFKIFISYRWEYAYQEAKMLQRALESTFDNVLVFRDEERAKKGESLTDTITNALNESSLVLAVLHKDWQQKPPKSPGAYRNKFFVEDDWVRFELDYAKNSLHLPVIPVLCHNACLPPRHDQQELDGVLPGCLQFLSDDTLAHQLDPSDQSEETLLRFLEKEYKLGRKKHPETPLPQNRLRDEGLELSAKLPDKTTVPKPFLGLAYFEEKHARLFFGRSDDICDLWDLIARKPHRLILLHGYSGVGKSSLLHAGLFPRIKNRGWTVLSERRRKNRSLSRLLADDMLPDAPQSGKTLLVIDQVEEALIEPFDDKEELPPFFDLLEKALATKPDLKVILGFRKEFLPEIEKHVPGALDAMKMFLEPLSDEGILEAIRLDNDLKNHYDFRFEDGLEEKIAASIVEPRTQLHRGDTSSKAPWLQMLLLNLWDTAESRSTTGFRTLELSTADFEHVQQDNFPKLVEEQLKKLETGDPHRSFFLKGLTLDLLHFLVTDRVTAGIRPDADLYARYPVPEAHLKAHIRLLENLQIVVRVFDRKDQPFTRLAHDSLAPVIRARFESSDALAQRAQRIFKSKMTGKTEDGHGKAVYSPIQDKDDILLLREARDWMYNWSAEEQAAFDQGAEAVEKSEARLRERTESVFDSFAGVGKNLIISLDHAEALKKFEVAVDVDIPLEKKRENLLHPLEELVFFFAEGSRHPELARKAAGLLLQLEPEGETLRAALEKCTAENWNQRAQFSGLLKTLPAYETFQQRYYPEMKDIAGDTFEMGRDSRYHPHPVALAAFRLATTPVTFYQYALYCEARGKSIIGRTPSWGRFGDHPLVNVSWYDAAAFCNWLSEQHDFTPCYDILERENSDENNRVDRDYLKWKVSWNKEANGFRLPTEAEWEFAARGGNHSKGFKFAGSDILSEVGWFWENSGDSPLSGDWDFNRILDNNGCTHPVADKKMKPNELGLYDMSGNVWEWCWDWYDAEYYQRCAKEGVAQNPSGPDGSDSGRVLRGGSWNNVDIYCLVSVRNRYDPFIRNYISGFRLAQDFE